MIKLTLISGRSGSGKSICLNILEDLGYYCISHLPLGLLTTLPTQLARQYDKVAVSLDVRNLKNDAENLDAIIEELKALNIQIEILYLDADDTKLIARFNETRRKHPLTDEKISLQEALGKENSLLLPFAQHADIRIDTSQLNVYQLRDVLRERVANHLPALTLLFQSFGFKHGIPHNSDYIFDVRCLPNPYWEAQLRAYTGLDQPVINYLAKQPLVDTMLNDIIQFLETWVPKIATGSRNYLTISIGCTGGQHRSVYLTELLAKHFNEKGPYHIQIRHKELG